jgi:aminoglycoside 6'-N-acetyltransferase I
MNGDVQIQIVKPDQFRQWRSLRDALYNGLEAEFHDREMDQIHTAEDQRCLVALAPPHTRVVGFVEISLRNIVDGCGDSPVGYFEGLYVSPEVRGRGIARALMQHAIEWFRQQGCSEIATDSELDDTEAQAFWSALGFEETWRVVQFRRQL